MLRNERYLIFPVIISIPLDYIGTIWWTEQEIVIIIIIIHSRIAAPYNLTGSIRVLFFGFGMVVHIMIVIIIVATI